MVVLWYERLAFVKKTFSYSLYLREIQQGTLFREDLLRQSLWELEKEQ
jgi:hypothetical protein